MRISDWSSDVCSSDLHRSNGAARGLTYLSLQAQLIARLPLGRRVFLAQFPCGVARLPRGNPIGTRGRALVRSYGVREARGGCQSSFLPLKSSGSPCSRLSLLHVASLVRSQSWDPGSPGWLGPLAHSGLASTAALLSRSSTPPQAPAGTTLARRTDRERVG